MGGADHLGGAVGEQDRYAVGGADHRPIPAASVTRPSARVEPLPMVPDDGHGGAVDLVHAYELSEADIEGGGDPREVRATDAGASPVPTPG